MTRLTGRCTVSWQDVVVDTLHRDRPFTVFQLAVHTCGYGRQCARRQSVYIGVDNVIHNWRNVTRLDIIWKVLGSLY